MIIEERKSEHERVRGSEREWKIEIKREKREERREKRKKNQEDFLQCVQLKFVHQIFKFSSYFMKCNGKDFRQFLSQIKQTYSYHLILSIGWWKYGDFK